MTARFLFTSVTLGIIGLPVSPRLPAQPATSDKPIRIGIIGLDTSHVIAFTQLLNDPSRSDHVPGARVVAAFKGGSPDMEASATRIEKFAVELKDKWGRGVGQLHGGAVPEVAAILLESVDGRTHLEQVRPVFAAKKRVFIDKPFAGSLRDAREIVRLARESGTPFFSSSSLRFAPEVQSLKKNPDLGKLLGAFTYSPAQLEPHHPDLFWYGIHGVEMLYALMGPGCESVTRVYPDGTDVVTGRWKDGRLGVFRGIREGAATYGAVVFGSKAVLPTNPPMKTDYRGPVVEIEKFFQAGVPPVSAEETLGILAFMTVGDVSKVRNGAAVALGEFLQD